MSYPHLNYQAIVVVICLSFYLLLQPYTLTAEGSIQLNPNGIAGDPCNGGATDVGDLAMVRLYTINADFPQFAGFGSYGTTNSICFTIKDPKEIVYISLSGAAGSGGECLSTSYDWRIVGPSGVAHGPFTLDQSNANGNDFGDILAGPDVFNAAGYSTAGEYTFQPTEAGEYCIEIDNYSGNVHLRNFDISVADCPGAAGNLIDGRLFSQNWAIRTPCTSPIIGCDEDPNVTALFNGFRPFQNPFDGKIYVLTSDNFVQEVDFGAGSAFGEGFRGLTFSLSFNLTGPGNTGNVLDDRQSKDGSNQTNANPNLFDVFLNPPDPTCYEQGMCGEIAFGPILNCANPLCVAYEATQPGLIELFLDIDGDGIYTPNSQDVFLADRILTLDDLEGCIPWDGEDGMGNIVDLGVSYDIFGRYSQGETHFMMYDVENNNPGYEISIVDPPCANPDFNMYWDDSQLDTDDNDSGFPGQPLISLTGTSQPTHIWEDQEDASALGYGESNTINTWFFSNINQIIAVSSCLPMIDIVKTGTFLDENADGLAQVGESISYVFIVTNNGNTDLEEISVTDPLVTVMGAPIDLLIGEIDNTTFTGSYILTQTDIDNMMFENVATVQGTDPNDGTIVMDTDPDNVMLPLTSMIMLSKTADASALQTPPQPGDIINYTFEVCNTGNTTLTNVTVSDPVVTVIGAAIASLPPGSCDMVSYTGTYAITSDDIAAEGVMNTAMTVGTDSKGDMVTDDDVADVPLQSSPMIMLTKTADASNVNDPAVVGNIITYSFEVCNTGNVDLTMVSVSDPLITVSGGPIATLAAGACDNTTFTAMYPITQADIDNEGIMNTATASGTDPNGMTLMDDDMEDVPLVANPVIEIVKNGIFNDENGDGLAQAGETISYIFTVSNLGNVTLINVLVTDPLVTVTGTPILTLLPGTVDMSTFSGNYILTQADVDAGMVENTATTMGTDPNGMIVMDDDPEMTNYTQSPEIMITKTGAFEDANGDGLAQVGEMISYEFTVVNTGNVTLTDVTVTDPIVTVSGGPLATLAPMASDMTTFTGTYILTQADIDNGTLPNTASTTGTDPNGMPVMDDDPEDVMLPILPEIELVKDGTFQDENGDGIAQVGETISYQFTVMNTGNVTLTNVTVTDPIVTVSGGPLATLAVGATDNTTFSGSYTLTQADIDNGMLANLATASGDDPNGVPTTDDDPEDVITPQEPAIELIKTGAFEDENGDGVAQVGETISYTFEVTNTGNVTLTNVSITDPIVTVTGGPIPTFAVGTNDNTTFTGMYSLTQADIDNGMVANLATVSGNDPNGMPVTDDDPEDVTIPQDPAIEIIKTGMFQDENGDGDAQVGESITYTFVVTNIGNVTLTNVTVTDPIITVSGIPIALAVGAAATTSFTGEYILTQADIDNGNVENLATTTGTDPKGMPVSDDDPEDVVTPQNPAIELVKTGVFQDENGDGIAQVGETISYSFQVSNTGNVTLTNVTVTDPLITVSGGPLPTLIVGQVDNTTFSGSYALTQSDINNGEVANVASTMGTDPNNMTIMDDDPDEVPIPQLPMIDIVKNGIFNDENGDGLAQPGETITYMFTVENTGNVTLTNVTVTDPLVTVSGGPIILMPGEIDNSTFSGVFTLTQAEVDDGMVLNLATTLGDDPNGDSVMDTDPEDTPYTQEPEIMLAKVGMFVDENGDGVAQVGESITYVFTVTNTGNVTLSGVTVTDPLVTVSGGPIASLAPGVTDDTTFSGVYLLTQADIDNGNVVNLATTSGNDPDGVPVMDEDPDDVMTPQDPAIELAKAGVFQDENGDGIAQVGETIAYTFIVMNTGNVTLSNVTISDPIVTVAGGPIASLAVGATDNSTFTGTYSLTQQDIDNGMLMNLATASGNDPSGNPTTDDDPEEVPTPQNPAIDLVKNGTFQDQNGDGIAQVGETINYSFIITNTGNVTLTDVIVTDPLVTVIGGPIPTLGVAQIDNTTFSGTYTLTQADIDNGNVENLATTMGTDPNGMPTTDDDPADVITPQAPSIEIVKNGIFNDTNGDGIAQPGETISYIFIVTNTGNVTLTGVTVTDPLVTVSGGPVTLVPGQVDNTSFTGLYTLDQADVDAASVMNLATTSGTDPNGDPVMDDDPEDTEYIQDPEILLIKTGVFEDENGDGIAQVGETMMYTFSVINTGNVTLTNVMVTDPLVTILGGPITTLAPGITDESTFTGSYTLTQEDIDNGNVANVATTSGTDPNGDPVMDDDPEDVDAPQNPAIQLSKEGSFQDENGDGIAQVGESISYIFTVENIGNVSITNVTITDPLVTIMGGPIALLPVGAVDNTTFAGVYLLTQSDIDNGNVANVAVSAGEDPSGDPVSDDDPEDIPTPQNPAIDLVKTGVFQDENGDGAAQVGETIAYSFSVSNTGNVTLTNVTVTDPIVTVVGGPIATLVVGEIDNTTFTGTYTLTQFDIDAGNVLNLATTSGTDPNGAPTTDDDPEDSDVPQVPGIDIVKNGVFNDENGDGIAQLGETLSYSFLITNTGNVTLTGITVMDPLVTVMGSPITLTPGQMDNITFSGNYTLTQADVDAGSVMNTATTSGDDPNGDPVMDDDPEETPYTQSPEILIVKTGEFQDENGDGAAQVGESISYMFAVTNTGNTTLTNITVTDPIVTVSGGPITTLAPGFSDNSTFTGTYILTQADIDAGGVANVATTSGTDPNGDPVMDDDPEDVTTPQDPSIDIVKSGIFQDENGDGIAQVGETIAYTFVISNTGNVSLTNIAVNDPLVTIMGGPIAVLPVGAIDNSTFTGIYSLTQIDIDNGGVDNVATASGDDPNGDPTMDNDPEDISTPQEPGIELIKSSSFMDGNGDGIAQVGETILYSFTVRNTGNVTLTNISITDPLVTVTGGPIPTLAVGATDNTTFSGAYTLTQADIDTGAVENVAVATGTDPNGDPIQDDDPEDTPTPQMPGIEILKNGFFNDENGDGIPQPGETLGYNFTVINTGNVTLTNVIVTDPLVTILGAAIPILPVGATDNMTFSGTYILTQQDVDNASVMNTAMVSGVDPNGDPTTDDDPEDTPYIQDPEILLMKTGTFSDENGDGLAQVGETISYEFTVTNTGNVTLTNVSVTDPLVTISGGPLSVLSVGQTDNTTFTGLYTLTQADINNGNVPNTAVTSGTDPNGDPVTDDDMEDELLPQMPGIDIVKMGTFQDENGDGLAQVGESINYVFVVENTGNVDLTNVTVNDPIVTVIGGPLALLAPGITDNTTFSGTYTLTQLDIDNGEVINVATASGDDPDGNPTTDNDPEETLTPQEPGIDIVKTGVFQDENGDGIPQVGETIAYIFVVSNTGNVTLSNIAVADPLITVMGGPLSTLAVGAVDNTTFSGAYELIQSDIDNGEVLNTATVTSEDPSGTPVNDDDMEDTPIEGAPGIVIEKTSVFVDENADGIPQVGESITYTFVVSNTGNVTLSNVTVTDPVVTVSGGPIPILEPGISDATTFSGIFILTQEDINNGEVVNTATATGTDPDGNTLTDDDDEETPFTLNPDISLLKEGTLVDTNGDGFTQAGETITYVFTVTNTGNVTLTNVTVTDPLVTISGDPIPVLNPGETDNTSFTGVYVVSQADIDAGMFENIATTTANDPNGDPVTDLSDDPQNPTDVDPDGDGDPDDPTVIPIAPMPAIEIEKLGVLNDENGDGISQVGETISYSFVISNTGNVTLTNIVVTDPLVTIAGGPIASLAPEQIDNTTFSGTYVLTQDDVDNGAVENTATVSGTDPSGNPINNTDTEDINTPQEPGIDIVKTSVLQDENGDGLAQVGESIAYSFVVSNTGNVTLTNIAVSDPLITVQGGPISTLPVGALDNTTFSGVYILTQADIDNGGVENTATITAEDPNGDPVNDDDMEETPIIADPGIEIVKTGIFQDENGDGIPQVGESLSYVFVVTNTGNVTLTNVTVTDPVVTVSGGPIPVLAFGTTDATTFSGTYILTLEDINNGEVLNTATVSGMDPNGNDITDDDDEQTPYTRDPDISVLKIGTLQDDNNDGFTQAGEAITYEFTVINTGNVTLTDVIVTDPLVTIMGTPIPVFNPGDVDNSTFTGIYILTQADIDSGMFENIALGTGTDPEGNPVTDLSDDPQNPTNEDLDGDGDPDDPTIINTPRLPAIEIEKIGVLNDENGDGISQVGETISYSFVITNTGNVTLTQIVVEDPLVTITGGPIVTLAPGEIDNTTFSGNYTLTQADVDNGMVQNTATVSGTDPTGNPVMNNDNEDIDTPQESGIDIVKTSVYQDENGDGLAQVGESIAYTFVVTNTGNVTLSNISVTDPLITVQGGPITTLDVGVVDNTTFTGIYILTQADVDNEEVINTAIITSEDPNGDPVTNDDTEETPIISAPSIEIVKTGIFQDGNGDGLPQVGESISYVFMVTNTGNVTLTNVTVTDPIVSVTGGPIPVFAPGSTDASTFSGTYILTLNDINNGEVLNTATVSGTDPNGADVMDSDDEQTVYNLNPDISLLKIGTIEDPNGDGITQAGEMITYTFTVINTGNVTLTNVTVTDPLVTITGTPIPVFNPGDEDSTTFTGVYTITQADIDAGMFENIATATGSDPNDEPVTDLSDDPQNPTNVDPDGDGDPDDPTVISIGAMPSLEIEKLGVLNDENGDGISQVGESISYSFVVTNSGNVTLSEVAVTDPLITIVGGPIATLSPGQIDNTTFSGTYTLTQNDINNGEVINTATGTANDPDGNPTTGTDTNNTPVIKMPCIELIKTSSLDLGADALATPGDIISYTYTVSNCGNVTLTNVTISEEDIIFTGSGNLPLPSAVVPTSLQPGETGIATATYIITQADIDATGIDNQALATGTDPDGNPVTDLSDTGNPNDPNETGGDDDPTYTPIQLPPGDISGFVFEDIDNNFVGDIPLVDVTITLIDSNGDTLRTVTDDDGFYFFLDVVPGPFTLIEQDPGDYFSVTDIDGGDPNVIVGELDPGEDKTRQDFIDAICDELICNNDLQISLNVACELVLTPDQLLEAAVPGNYDIMLYNEDGDYIRDDTLTAAEAGMTIKYQISCLENSCWGHIIVEANIIPQLESPCECNAEGIIPDECKFLCGLVENLPTELITVEEAEEAFGNCGPDLLGDIKVTEIITGDICSDGGEIVELIYTGKVITHGTIKTIDILCQRYSTIKLDVDTMSFDFPESLILDCDYLDHIVVPDGEDPIDYELGEPASILASTGNPSMSYPTFIPNAVEGYDLANYIVPQVVTIYDTVLVEVDQVLKDTMVAELIGADTIWVLKTVVDKVYEQDITRYLDTVGVMDAAIPIFERFCNVLAGYSDVEFEACGQGKKILRTWNLIDWCSSDVTISANQTIEIIDITPPQIVEFVNGKYVPVRNLSDLVASIEPWSCSAKVKLPELKTLDNCDENPSVHWDTYEGRVENGYLIDLWLSQSPITAIATVSDDCGNTTEIPFNVIVIDDVPPVTVCETSLQVSLTGSSNDYGIAKINASDLDEGSHDSECGKVTITAVRLEDWRDPVRDCQENIVGYAPRSCAPLTADVDLGAPAFKNDCDATGENIGQITVAGEYVKVCCEDLGKIIQVIVFVEDEQGNINQCIVSIEVVDKSAPSLVCEDTTVSCSDGDSLAPPAMLGSSCERETPFRVELLRENRGNNVCAGGQVIREWYVDLDLSGDFSTGDPYCQQIVRVDAETAFDPKTIKWPKHYDGKDLSGINLEFDDDRDIVEVPKTIAMGDVAACTPDDIGEDDNSSATLGIPVWCDTECGLVGYTMDTDTIKASDACLKIIRRWTIVDWCTYDANSSSIDDENDSARDSFEAVEDWVQFEADAPGCPHYAANTGDAVYFRYTNVDRDGYYTYDQVIVVDDDTAPEIESPATYEVNTSGGAVTKDDNTLCIGEEVITVRATDLCGGEMTGASLLEWQITVSKNGNVVASKNSRGAEASMSSQEGSPGDVHIITWRVKDGCGNSTSSQTRVTFGDQQNPTPFCVAGLTTAFMASDGSVAVWGKEFDFGSFDNCTDASELRFSLVRTGEEPIRPGQPGFSDQTGITFHCEELANYDELDMWVWDAYGNGDFCTVGILISDNGNQCPEDNSGDGQVGSTALISGQVHTYYDMMIEDAQVTVQATDLTEYPKAEMTNTAGQYSFENNPMDYNYNLQAAKEDSYVEGVTTLDIVMMQRHILSLDIFDNPYQIIASDASGDGKISAQDLTQFRRLILGVTDNLPNSLPWIFVDASQSFFDEGNPWPFAQDIDINSLADNMLTEDFIGIKMGDVNQSYQGAESRSVGLLRLEAENARLSAGEVTTVHVRARNFNDIAGYQFTMSHEGLHFMGIDKGVLDVNEDNIGLLEGQISMSWNTAELLTATPDDILFSLHFEANTDVELKFNLAINSSVTKAEAYVSSDYDLYAIDISFGEDHDEMTLYQNLPNPFTGSTTIGFELDQAGSATLTIFDLSGKEIKKLDGQYVRGYNAIKIDAEDLNVGGVLYYQLENDRYTATKKMILMK